MKILFYFGHPAQYLFLRATMKNLISNYVEIKILIKTKDVLENLLINDGFEYINILSKERGISKISIVFSLIKRILKIFPIVLRYKPDLMVSTDATIAQIGKFLNIDRITIIEDDYEIIRKLGDLTYPFTQTILCPEVCSVGKWGYKKIGYNGYMKLGYLHPNVFSLDLQIISKYNFPKKYVIIRLAKLTAHHDFGIKGLNSEILEKLIQTFEKQSYDVYLSIEGDLDKKYNKYILNIDPSDMHHVLSASSFLICDSQSMSVEAAILGVPSIRFSSFAGKISVLEELEHKYHLTFGIDPSSPELLFSKLNNLLKIKELKKNFNVRKIIMLQDKIDVTAYLTWFFLNYPNSVDLLRENTEYQYKFK